MESPTSSASRSNSEVEVTSAETQRLVFFAAIRRRRYAASGEVLGSVARSWYERERVEWRAVVVVVAGMVGRRGRVLALCVQLRAELVLCASREYQIRQRNCKHEVSGSRRYMGEESQGERIQLEVKKGRPRSLSQ